MSNVNRGTLGMMAMLLAGMGTTFRKFTSLEALAPVAPRPSRRKGKLAGHSNAPLRENGAREMARRVRQMANGTHGL